MKSTVAGHVFHGRRRTEANSNLSFEARLHTVSICGHELLPVLSRDLDSDEIHGWECIFCNENFENYSAARPSAESASSYTRSLT